MTYQNLRRTLCLLLTLHRCSAERAVAVFQR